jgi:AraC-like DNA-binding protein
MKHPILLNIKQQFPKAVEKQGAQANCRYRIPYAEKKHWQTDSLGITIQDHDAKDAYLSLIEIKAKESFTFIIRITESDLFWLYLLNGTIKIVPYPKGTEHNGFLDKIKEDEYGLFYSPPREYQVTVEPGLHILFLFVVNSTWLQRHPILEATHYQKLIGYLQHKKDRYNSTELLPIHAEIRKEILHLLTLRDFGEMLMDSKIYPHIVRLVLISREDLNEQKKQLSINAKKLLIHIREYCEKQISDGKLPLNKEIAEHFQRSEQYIARIHKQEYGETLENFQIVKRLEICRQQIRETNKSQTEIAYDFGYSDVRHFISQYQKHLGITPSEERFKMRKKK